MSNSFRVSEVFVAVFLVVFLDSVLRKYSSFERILEYEIIQILKSGYLLLKKLIFFTFQDDCAGNCFTKYLKMSERISLRFQEFQLLQNEGLAGKGMVPS